MMFRPKIIIATATRNRPKMILNLYRSFAKLEVPTSVSVEFLVVENNHVDTSENWIAEIASEVRFAEFYYLLEKNIGISSARNRALEHALQVGAHFLVFVDDDEIVEPNWLNCLLAEQRRNNLDIVGSPVRPVPLSPKLNFWQQFVWSGIVRNSVKAERRARIRWQKNRADTIKLATGSWIGKVDFFGTTGLRFDPQLGLTGGEDWLLWHEAKRLGARTGWAPNAIVYETVPSSRISFSYQFRRNRDHNATEFALSYRENPQRAIKQVPIKLLSRSWKALSAVCTLPFKGGRSVISLAMALGAIVGLLQATGGRRPKHYRKTTGQ